MVGELVMKLWLFGGNSNYGANCGLAYAYSNNAWTLSGANISARHTFNGREQNYKGVITASRESTRLP